ncbi:hypothetical protein SBRCBS47491_001968 [Sporothrix bragantina]|uniref:DNA polymerase epsilon subunit D n=1 Tax=Sporothrix bragantina TaxID=671064 RepID=A0ABP0B301_9PEZI
MPPRKSDAAARKSDAGAAAPAAVTDEARPTTATSQAPSLAELVGTADPLEQRGAADARPATAEKEKEPSKPRNSDAVTIEDLNMPRSIITRLAKGVLPPNTQIQGSAITGMSKSATVFISHLANAANNITTNAGKKTIMPADVFAALDDIEFGFMREQLEAEFAKFNHIQTSKRSDYRKRVAAAKKGADATGGDDGDDADVSAMGADGDVSLAAESSPAGKAAAANKAKGRDVPPQAKKAKRAHETGSGKGGKANGSGAIAGDETDNNATEADEEDVEMAEEEEEEGHEQEDEEEEEEEDDEEEEEGDEEEEEGDEDEMEEREDAADDDEALDSDGSE